jgi:hypothetical protein
VYTMLLFVGDILVRAWQSFLVAIGTTGLGFLANNIEQLIAIQIATHFFIWIFRGPDAMRNHKKQNLLIGALAYATAVLIVYAPIYIRQVSKVRARIETEADKQTAPSFGHSPSPPAFAYETSPASITVSLIPQQGFAVDLGGPYKFDDKKQYRLVFKNLSHSLKLADIEARFPYPVEAQRIVTVSKIAQVTFMPTRPLINLVGAQLQGGGCLGRWSYRFTASQVAAHGMAQISLILNGYSSSHPSPDVTIHQGNGYVAGFFVYQYRGKITRHDYYAELVPGQDMTIKMTEPQSQTPLGFKKSSGFTVLMGPCIPDNSLLSP